jgi:hypothetical protein
LCLSGIAYNHGISLRGGSELQIVVRILEIDGNFVPKSQGYMCLLSQIAIGIKANLWDLWLCVLLGLPYHDHKDVDHDDKKMAAI